MKHQVVGRDDFQKAHADFLKKEKELMRAHDELAKQRRDLPWTLVEKNYVFHGPEGDKILADLFNGKSQLIVQHFMFGPEWNEGCEGCSFMADHIDGALVHLSQRDVNFVAVSRAPLTKLDAYKKRMNWHFPWYSSKDNEFNFDFHVSFSEKDKTAGKVNYNYKTQDYQGDELPGMSVFYKNSEGDIFHTYSTFARGAEQVMGTYVLLDMLPKGRDEVPFKVHPMEWVKRHDEYGSAKKDGCCH